MNIYDVIYLLGFVCSDGWPQLLIQVYFYVCFSCESDLYIWLYWHMCVILVFSTDLLTSESILSHKCLCVLYNYDN